MKKFAIYLLIISMLLSQSGITAFAANENNEGTVIELASVSDNDIEGENEDVSADELSAGEKNITDTTVEEPEESLTSDGLTNKTSTDENTVENNESDFSSKDTNIEKTEVPTDSVSENDAGIEQSEALTPSVSSNDAQEAAEESLAVSDNSIAVSENSLTVSANSTTELLESQTEMELTSAMLAEKEELSGTADRLIVLREDVEYKKHEAVFEADSVSYALEVAEGYGATLASFENGLAVIEFDEDIMDIIRLAEDMDVKLPAVYPNYIYSECTAMDGTFVNDYDVNDELSEYAISNDTNVASQTYHTYIHTADAWKYNPTAGKGIKVAVIDSGITSAHEDMKNRIVSASSSYETPWNSSQDNNGHGTHVSGIIAANKDNERGGAGIAYNSAIISVKAMEVNPLTNKATGDTAGVIRGINSAVKSGARVINLSLGGNYYDALFEEAIDSVIDKGVVVVVAAGNSTVEMSSNPESEKFYSPACFEDVITVSAAKTSSTAGIASFSNYGAGVIDITAPGTSIYSTYKGSTNDNYTRLNGTSQASPMVAATAAYILSVSPDLRNSKTRASVELVTAILKESAQADAYANSAYFGAGLLDVENAVKMAAPSVTNNTELKKPMGYLEDGSVIANNQVVQDTDYISLKSTLGDWEDEDIQIYYTTNGKTPLVSEEYLYKGPFRIEASGTKTIKALAVYYGRKTGVSTIKVRVNAYATDFDIASKSGVFQVGAGKSLTLTANDFSPTYTTNKKVTWELVSGAEYATLNAGNGVLKAVKGITEPMDVEVKATAKDGSGVFATKTIIVIPAVSSLKLEDVTDAKCTLTYPETKQMEVVVTPSGLNPAISYTSSNKKVATVSETGLITSVGNGKATITAKTTDGSNKSVKMVVTVKKPVDSIMVTTKTGNDTIGANRSVQMVASVTKDATNRKVTWSILEGTSVATIHASNGALKTAKIVEEVTTITVVATACDGSGVIGKMEITIYPTLTSKILLEGGISYNMGTKSSGMLTTTLQLLPYTDQYTTAHIGREKESGNVNLSNYTYTSTNKKVATVDTNGMVTAHAVGTTKIKIAAKDGSGKSITCTVKVVNPVTSISISSKSGVNFVGKGRSLSLIATVNKDATNKKLKWTSSNTSVATVNGSGKVTGKSYGEKSAVMYVTATATDGSGIEMDFVVYVRPAIRKLVFEVVGGDYRSSSCKDLGIYGTDTYEELTLGSCFPYYYDDLSPYVPVVGEDYNWDAISYSCSNTNVVQIVKNEAKTLCVVGMKKGTAYIKFKALDGSGKTASLQVRVK